MKGNHMHGISRRSFIKSGVVGAGTAIGLSAENLSVAQESQGRPASEQVHFLTDGLMQTPLDYSQLLLRICKDRGIKSDTYLSGGSVEELEKTFAKMLGKESAVFVPTGTLANHLALRVQCEGKSRVLVQSESHIYRDSLDCVETLSHLNLVPLADSKATFTLPQAQDAVQRAADGPFPLQVGAISIECPVRRMNGKVFDFEEMKKISQWARARDIKLHLDGARMFIASAYTGIAPEEYASLFDTVYVSLYKYFNAATGAVLAGPKKTVEQVAHGRKLFGGGLLQAWPYTAVALHYADGFLERFRKAVANAQALFDALQQDGRIHVEPFPQGTNIYRLHLPNVNAEQYAQTLRKSGVLVRLPRKGSQELSLFVNESVGRRSATELAKVFLAALPPK
jgi:threonine aldolase